MRPDREAIGEFIRITGASELEAIRTLEEYLGNLNNAINAHFVRINSNTRRNMSVSTSRDDRVLSPGIVTVDNEDTHTAPIAHPAVQDDSHASTDSGSSTIFFYRSPEYLVIEEQKFYAAIAASERDAKMHSDLDDSDIERVLGLSLETAKEERAERARGEEVGPSHKLADVERRQCRFEQGSSSVKDEHDDVEEKPLSRRTSRQISPGSVHTKKGTVKSEGSPSSTPQQPIGHHPQQKESDLHLDEDLERQLVAKEASLPKEPLPGDENAVLLVVQMPDDSRRSRRFLKSHKLQHVFDFIDISRMVKRGSYRLVRYYPRRVFSCAESGVTLNEAGMTCKLDALFLELI